MDDQTGVWFHQELAGRHVFLEFYENSGEGLQFYLNCAARWMIHAVFGCPEHSQARDKVRLQVRITDMGAFTASSGCGSEWNQGFEKRGSATGFCFLQKCAVLSASAHCSLSPAEQTRRCLANRRIRAAELQAKWQ